MKFIKDPESGQMLIELKYDESFDQQAEEILEALLASCNEQAKQIYKLTNCYKKLEERLNKLEKGEQL